jgi:dephospho-CoA kinase
VRIGLTGGVGAGKSTVAALLAERGAVVVDADAIAREVVRSGTPGFDGVVGRFGAGIVGPDGELDRPGLAAIVFADPAALADLNGIVHPLVRQRSAELLAAAPAEAVVVYDVPLLVENDQAPEYDLVFVVEAPLELRLERLAARGLPAEQAKARMAAQASDEDRRAVADEVIVNDGDRARLAERVDVAWRRRGLA